jgi:hypothetical protein
MKNLINFTKGFIGINVILAIFVMWVEICVYLFTQIPLDFTFLLIILVGAGIPIGVLVGFINI